MKQTTLARQAAIRKVPSLEKIIRGSLMEYWRTCGNRGCRCYRGKKYRHGPYWYLAIRWAGGRQKLVALKPSVVSEIRKGIVAYKRLWDGVYEIAELNLELLLLGAKSKG